MSQSRNKIDSNITGLAVAEEVLGSLGELPDGVLPDTTESALTANDATIADVQISWDQSTSRLNIQATTGPNASGDNLFFDVIEDVGNAGTTFNRVGTLLVQQAGQGYTTRGGTSDALGEWSPDDIPATQGVSLDAVVDLTNFLTLGNRYIVMFANSEADLEETLATSTGRDILITTVGTGPVEWFEQEPNEYDDFGAEVETTAREIINPSRQKRKGVVTDLDADGGFQSDLTQDNLQRLMQGFCFADARQKATTAPLSQAYALRETATINGDGTITFSGGSAVASQFTVNDLIRVSNSSNSANNGTGLTLDVTGDTITLADIAAAQADSTDTILVEKVGVQLTAGATSITLGSGVMTISNATDDLETLLGVIPGEWIFIGGDLDEYKFDNNGPGFARVRSVSADELVIEQVTWANPMTEAAAAGKSIQIFLGTVIKNEDNADLIKCRSYQIERTLGQDDFGTQAEYLVGAVCNELTANFSSTEKVTVDLGFVGKDTDLRNGSDGPKDGDRITPPFLDAYNTSNDIFQMRLYVHDNTAVTPGSVYAFVREAELTINNNVTGLKAVGTLGNFDLNVGNFDVGGEIEAYFTEVSAIAAVKNNEDTGFNAIGVKDNSGWVFDIPLLSLGNGRLQVELNEPIMIPLEKMGAENEFGYTLLQTWFPYLPTVAGEL